MAHTYSSCFIHAVFSAAATKDPLGERAREVVDVPGRNRGRNGFRLIAANGSEDHVHLLMKLPSVIAPARAIQILKKRSAAFMGRPSAWQEGYAAVSIDVSSVDDLVAYLARQTSLHSDKTLKRNTSPCSRRNAFGLI